MILQAKDIDISSVTETQLGACHKVIHTDGNYYLVENSKGELDESGYIKEYKVSWSKARGFGCQCEAAYRGKLCWHIRASVACEREVKQAIAELEAAIAEQAAPVLNIDGKPASAAEVERVMNAPAKPASRRAKAYEPRPFSLI